MRLQRFRFRPQIDVLSSRITPSGGWADAAVMPDDEPAGYVDGSVDPASIDGTLNDLYGNSAESNDPMEPQLPETDEYTEARPMPPSGLG